MTFLRSGLDLARIEGKQTQLPRNASVILRINAEFVLKSVSLLREFVGGDLLQNLVFAAIWLESMRDVPYTETATGSAGHRPVMVREVADRLQLPYETVRRHANALVRKGHCIRVAGKGLIVTPGRERLPAGNETLRAQYALLSAFVSALGSADFDARAALSAATNRVSS